MPLFFTEPEDDGWTTFIVALSIATVATGGATLILGFAAYSAHPETTEPVVAVLFGVGTIACVVLGAELWAVSPLPGQTHPPECQRSRRRKPGDIRGGTVVGRALDVRSGSH